MSEASPSRLIARHPFRSVALATLFGLVFGRSGTARKSFDIAATAARAVGSMGLAADVVSSIVKLSGKKL